MENDRSKPPIPFHSTGLPIVGQPFEIVGWMFSAVIVCKCDGRRSLLATSTGIVQCPSCKKGYVIAGVDAPPGHPANFSIQLVAPPGGAPQEN
jgi:hypothetical protein